MNDLAEHIGTVLWIAGGLLFICGVFITLIWNDMRKSIAEAKRVGCEFNVWLKKVGTEEGGVVTRKQYFEWCIAQQQKCPACEGYRVLTDWRNRLLDQGGIMTKNGVVDFFEEKLCAEFEHHRNLMAAELKLIRGEIALVKSDIANSILMGLNGVKKELLQEMSAVEKRSGK